jgi:hypothetical protein
LCEIEADVFLRKKSQKKETLDLSKVEREKRKENRNREREKREKRKEKERKTLPI